jgi:hypothetical protein
MNAELKLVEPAPAQEPALLVRVDPRYPGAWEAVEPFLQAALTRGGGDRDWLIEDVRASTSSGETALWAVVTAGRVFGAVVTREIYYPRRKVMEVLLTGTEANTDQIWAQCLDQLKYFAKLIGCQTLLGTGRPGWGRKLGAIRERRVWEFDL